MNGTGRVCDFGSKAMEFRGLMVGCVRAWQVFKYLESLDVEDFKDVKSGYSISFVSVLPR